MRITPKQDHINKIKNTWQGIGFRMNERGIGLQALANATGYSRDRIERGLRGGTEPLSSDFLHACVNVFGLKSARAKFFEETDDILPDDESMELLGPPPAKPPRQGNLWDD